MTQVHVCTCYLARAQCVRRARGSCGRGVALQCAAAVWLERGEGGGGSFDDVSNRAAWQSSLSEGEMLLLIPIFIYLLI